MHVTLHKITLYQFATASQMKYIICKSHHSLNITINKCGLLHVTDHALLMWQRLVINFISCDELLDKNLLALVTSLKFME